MVYTRGPSSVGDGDVDVLQVENGALHFHFWDGKSTHGPLAICLYLSPLSDIRMRFLYTYCENVEEVYLHVCLYLSLKQTLIRLS